MHRSVLLLAAAVAVAGTAAAQWTQLSPATSPPARAAAGMAYDPNTDRLMLFGGTALFTQFTDTWTYDGASWTLQSPAVSPPAKFAMDIVFDTNRNVFVMYGGNATFSNPGTNQTWEYDGVTWTQRFPANNPGNLGLHAMAFDSTRNVVVLYGGIATVGPIVDSNQTWEYDGVNWTQRFPTTNPGRLEALSMCFHAGVGKTILFGGVNANPSTPPSLIDSDKTWAFDGTNWAELPVPGTRPLKRERARLAYDPVRQVCVLVGGMHYSNGQVRSDTWELQQTGATWTWTQVVSPGLPANFYRFQSTLAFMPGDRHLVQFGGLRGTSTYLADTAEYGASTAAYGFGCLGSNGVPTLSATSGPRIGEPWTATAANLNPSLSFAILALGFSQLPGVDLGPLLGMYGCNGYASPDLLLTMASGAPGSASWTWSGVAGPVGAQFFCQALCLDPGITSFGFTISNALSATLGY